MILPEIKPLVGGVELADSEGLSIKVVELVGGKDPDEIAQKDPDKWLKLTKNPIGIYDYFINSALTRLDGSSSGGKRKIGAELCPIFGQNFPTKSSLVII